MSDLADKESVDWNKCHICGSRSTGTINIDAARTAVVAFGADGKPYNPDRFRPVCEEHNPYGGIFIDRTAYEALRASLATALAALVEKEERLQALLPYVQHQRGCPKASPGNWPVAAKPCTCGLAALQSLPKEET